MVTSMDGGFFSYLFIEADVDWKENKFYFAFANECQ